MISKLAQLTEMAKTGKKQRIALAAAADEDALLALDRACAMGVAEGILVGNPEEIHRVAAKCNIAPESYRVIPAENDTKAALEAVSLVSSGQADLLMKGRLATSVLLKAVLDKKVGLRTNRTLSHVAIAEVPGLDHLVFVTDAAMNIAPSLEQKASIVQNAADVARCLGWQKPRVAMLSNTNRIDESNPHTLEAAVLSKMAERGALGPVDFDGPMTLASALSPDRAALAGVHSDVAGRADVLLVSHIEAGNVLYKGLVYFADSVVAGVLAGAKAPVILTSRADSDQAKLYSIALGAVFAAKKCEVSA